MRTLLPALFAALCLQAAPAAAAIVWSDPVDSTGKSTDVINTGELLDAGAFGATTTVNGVTFNHTSLGVPNTARYGVLSGYGAFGPEWDPEYRRLVESTAYLVLPSQLELDLGVLPVGSYLMQLFLPQWDTNWATAFSLNGYQSAPVQAGGPAGAGPLFPPSSRPQWIAVTFDADGVTDYKVHTEHQTTYQLLAAFQLRTVPGAVPEPATWLVMILGFGLAGAALRRAGPAARALPANRQLHRG